MSTSSASALRLDDLLSGDCVAASRRQQYSALYYRAASTFGFALASYHCVFVRNVACLVDYGLGAA